MISKGFYFSSKKEKKRVTGTLNCVRNCEDHNLLDA